MARRIGLALAALALVLWLMPAPAPVPPVREDRLLLGTLVTIKLYGDAAELEPLLGRAFAEFERVDSLMSRQRPDGALERIERAAARGGAVLPPAWQQVMQRALYWAGESGGAFDPTLGALTRLWNFPDARAVPAAARIDSARALTGYRHVHLEAGSLHLRRGVRLDLGAAAKGYAVDRAVALLRGAGVVAGLVEAGGDIRYWGRKPDGRAWRFGIQHPRAPQRLFEVDDIGLAAIATSGDYEQYFEAGGVRYHHLLDPATGYPARGAISATAWAETAMDADILSTAIFVLGPERGIEWAEAQHGVEALVFSLDADGELRSRATRGVAGHFRLAE